VLFLDADSLPLVHPRRLFDTPEFKRHGNVFWGDGRWAGCKGRRAPGAGRERARPGASRPSPPAGRRRPRNPAERRPIAAGLAPARARHEHARHAAAAPAPAPLPSPPLRKLALLKAQAYKAFGLVPPWYGNRDFFEAESGQLLIDRSRHADALEWAWCVRPAVGRLVGGLSGVATSAAVERVRAVVDAGPRFWPPGVHGAYTSLACTHMHKHT
jgi:hypothetical protein